MMCYNAPWGLQNEGSFEERYAHKLHYNPGSFDLSTWTLIAYGNLPRDGTRTVRAVRQDNLAIAFGVDWWEVD